MDSTIENKNLNDSLNLFISFKLSKLGFVFQSCIKIILLQNMIQIIFLNQSLVYCKAMNSIKTKINLIKKLSYDSEFSHSKTLEINLIFDGDRRKILEIEITNGDKLKKHRAIEPITILCLSGKGTFYAGEELEESLELAAGTLITLEPNIQHEIEAQPNIRLLLTKYTKGSEVL